MATKVTDLRSALRMLEDMPGQLIETDVEVEHILAVHYTKYDIENIDGETVEVDGDGKTV